MSNSCGTTVAAPPVSVVGFLVADDGGGRLRLFGELDASEVHRVRSCLVGVGVDGDVELECSRLRFIDASGLGLFVELDTACRARRAKLLIINPSRYVARLLELTGLDSLVTSEAGSPVR